MDDSDNNTLNRDQVLPEEANIELKINRRSLGIYEQYLRKTNESLACAQQSSKLNEDESKYLSESEIDCFTNFSDTHLDNSLEVDNPRFTTQENIAAENTLYPHMAGVSFKNNALILESRENNSSKLIIAVAGFCALLLIAVLVIAFNANNNLVTLTDRLSSVNNQMSAVSKDISVIGQENSLANAKAIADDKAERAANAAKLASVNESLNTIAVNIKPIEYKPTAPATTRVRSMKVSDVNTQPEISYDDFKNESQITVYREANN